MSANNYILVRKEENKFVVEARDADTGENNYVVGTVDSLEEAVKIAQEDSEHVEYGITFRL